MKKDIPKSLNICITSRSFSPLARAAENSYIWPISKGLAEAGHKVTILAGTSSQGVSQWEKDGVQVYYVSAEGSPYKSLSFEEAILKQFWDLHEKTPFDIVHSACRSGLPIAKQKKKFRIPVAFDIRATQISQIFSILGMSQETAQSLVLSGTAVLYKYLRTYFGGDRALLRAADGLFVSSPRQRIVLERYYFFADAKVYTVPFGIEVSDLSPREKSDSLRESLNIPADGHVAVTPADMTSMNEITNILKAFEKVAIKKPKSRLIIIGHGPLRKQVEKNIYDLALGSKVILVGAISNAELPDYIALSDVFIDISVRTTGFEPSMLEAMGQKKVIVGSEVGAMSSLVEDGVDGFLIRPADVSSLSQLLLDIFTGRLQTLEIGDRARRKVVNLFDPEKMVGETIKSYYSILRQSKYYKKG